MTQGSSGGSDSPRIDALKRMLEARPDDARAQFGLAIEYDRLQRWEDAIAALRRYLELAEDEENAYGRLGNALLRLGREEEARQAFAQGAEVAYRHGHPTMAQEFEERLEEMGSGP
jgi:Flp pilus assembly protein TadD